MEQQPEQKAQQLISQLYEHRLSGLANSLTIDGLAAAYAHGGNAFDRTQHPLIRLIESGIDSGLNDHSIGVLHNIDRALRAVRPIDTAAKWATQTLNKSCRRADFEKASADLGEIRAFGALWEAGFEAEPIPTSATSTPDFRVTCGNNIEFVVEVHSKSIGEKTMTAWDGGVRAVYPAGIPKPGESTAENVASKFAGIKPGAAQAVGSVPAVLWLDVQSTHWWAAADWHLEPVSLAAGVFFSGGLWQALYGTQGTPMFEHHRRYEMAHPGLFEQSPAWSAVVVTLPRTTALFENPASDRPLSDDLRGQLVRLNHFDLGRSRMDWPVGSLASRLAIDRDLISAVERELEW